MEVDRSSREKAQHYVLLKTLSRTSLFSEEDNVDKRSLLDDRQYSVLSSIEDFFRRLKKDKGPVDDFSDITSEKIANRSSRVIKTQLYNNKELKKINPKGEKFPKINIYLPVGIPEKKDKFEKELFNLATLKKVDSISIKYKLIYDNKSESIIAKRIIIYVDVNIESNKTPLKIRKVLQIW
jgi:hypothetical protein